MHELTQKTTWSALLHDVGKAAYRAGERGTHSESGYRLLKPIISDTEILDGVRYHHSGALKNASLSKDSLAYIVYTADNIAAAADRRAEEEGTENSQRFQKDVPLTSIFSYLNGSTTRYQVPLNGLNDTFAVPKKDGTARYQASEYRNLLDELLKGLRCIQLDAQWTNSVLSLLEACTSSMPSSTNTEERADISLFDHVKMTAAAGAAISEYLLEQQESDFKTRLFVNEKEFWKENAFLLYSADFSGIQNFIYTIASAHAMKSLRSRSFFLELVMEHYIDEVLNACGLSRANLLYSGGGHCYMLLPNTSDTVQALKSAKAMMNKWLKSNFGIRLYLADGYTTCSANDLTNTPAVDAPYKAMFERVSHQISINKMHRYSAQDVLELNHGEIPEDGRECKICGISSHLTGNGENCKCQWCALFERLSNKIQNKDNRVFVVSRQKNKQADIVLPTVNGEVTVSILTEKDAEMRLQSDHELVRVYTKNKMYTGLTYSTKLYMGDYFNSNLMNELAEKSTGITRIAICRMDVDNLGMAFIAGFEQDSADAQIRYKYVTLSRTATFSRQLSLFFKFYINQMLDGLAVNIVYSGGDDVFLVGAWDAVLQAAQKIQEEFRVFTCNTLTLSAGILLENETYPIRRAATRSAELEAFSKKNPQKNSVTLFDASEAYRYDWTEFREKVIGEKLHQLQDFFEAQKKLENGRGKAFLYRLLDLLRSSKEQINLARFAYLLARMEPKDKKSAQLYRTFSKNMYAWYRSETDRKQLITAIYIYVYLSRMEDD